MIVLNLSKLEITVHQYTNIHAYIQIKPSSEQQWGLGSNRSRDLRETVHTHRASIHQAVKLVAALLVLRVARVTTGLAESNGSLPPGL